MNNIEFANKAKAVAEYSTLYVMGCFGAPMTVSNKKRYSNNHSYNKKVSRTKMIQAASADTFGFDCSGLVKGVLWGWNGTKTKTYGGAKYASNNVPDIGADRMISNCKEVSTNFNDVEIGEIVWMSGHVGIYIGDGLVVESTPSWKNGVQITACNRDKKGYNRRNWTKHGKLPYVEYVENKPATPAAPAKKSIDEIAKEVMNGKWGNGAARKSALTKAGYDYDTVQKRVNELNKKASTPAKKSIDTIAKEVMNGKWGNGAARKAALTKAGYDYATVQKRVNELCK